MSMAAPASWKTCSSGSDTNSPANRAALLDSGPIYAHPAGRKAVFVGDLVDRGPRVLDVARIVHNMVRHGSGLCVPGNHDMKLLKKLHGRDIQITHGLAQTLAEI